MKAFSHANYSIFYISQITGRDSEGNLTTVEVEGPFFARGAADRAIESLRELRPRCSFVVEQENQFGESKIVSLTFPNGDS